MDNRKIRLTWNTCLDLFGFTLTRFDSIIFLTIAKEVFAEYFLHFTYQFLIACIQRVIFIYLKKKSPHKFPREQTGLNLRTKLVFILRTRIQSKLWEIKKKKNSNDKVQLNLIARIYVFEDNLCSMRPSWSPELETIFRYFQSWQILSS